MNKNVKIINIVGAAVILVLASLPSVFGLVNNPVEVENVNGQIGFSAINIDEITIAITMSPGEFEFGSIITEEGMFATVSVPSFVFSMVKGEAKLSIIRRMIEIPQKSNPEIRKKELEEARLYLGKLFGLGKTDFDKPKEILEKSKDYHQLISEEIKTLNGK